MEKIITIDPHTTFALKVLYPKYTGVKFEVKSYPELLAENLESINTRNDRSYRRSEKEFSIHDPCYCGRYLEISSLIRDVLKKAKVEYILRAVEGF